MDFIIRKDIYGSWWHDYNNDATKINISDFEAVIDSVANTFIIQCKNGSNVPTMAISIANVKVINQIVSNTPISFSGAVGLKNLLTSLSYTPYLQGTITGQVVVYRVGQVGVFTMTPTQFTDNFTETGLGTSTMTGWALRNGSNGTKNQQGKFSLNKGAAPYDVIGTLGGSANSVLIGHDHDSSVTSDIKKGVSSVGTGGSFAGYNEYTGLATGNILKTSVKGQSNNGVDVPSEDGIGKNMPPYLIDVWVERVTDLVINTGSGGGGIQSIVAGTNIAVDNTDPLNPIVSATGSAGIPTLQQVVNEDNLLTDTAIIFESIGNPNLRAQLEINGLAFIENDGVDEKNITYDLNGITKNVNANGVSLYFEDPTGVGTIKIKDPINEDETLAFLSDITGGGAVDSVNGQTGVVVLDADDIDDTSTTNKFTTSAEISKLAGIEANADVTDSTNVNAAGAVMNSDYSSHSILVQQSGSGSPTSLQISNNTLVGRLSGGGSDINDLSVSQVKGLLDFTTPTDVQTIADGKVSDAIVDGVTTVAPSQNAVFDALALKQDILGYSPIKKIVADTVSSSAVTGVTTETLCKTYTISANTFADGDFMKVLIGLEKTGVLGTATVRIRVNQTNNFATATLIGTYTPSAASHVAVLFKRDFLSFKSGVLKGINFTVNTQNDLGAGASFNYNTTTLSPTSDFYLYVSVINVSLIDSTIVNQVQITN
jgi:hypothetical protein